MANTTFTQKSTCLALGTFVRCQASKVNPTHHLQINTKIKYNRFSVPERNLGLTILQNVVTRKMNMAVYASVQPGAPFPVDPSPGPWKVWIIGAVITVLLSFSKGKWGPLINLKEKIETTIDEAEHVADIVEEVAEDVEKVTEEAAKHLPEGKLHDAAEFVEKVAEEVDKDAEIAEDALKKVDDVEKDVESFFESTPHEEKTVVTAEAKDEK